MEMDNKTLNEVADITSALASVCFKICRRNKEAAVNLLRLTADLLEETKVV